VYLLSPRNFGLSDRHESFDLAEQVDDVARFMYENKISTATLAGHGYGGKLALAVGCYHAERVTGVFCIDTAPLDHRYFEAFKEFKHYVIKSREIPKNLTRGQAESWFTDNIADSKWRKILSQNLTVDSSNKLAWRFEMEYLYHNLHFNKADSIGYWAEKHGIYTGRVNFIFPEYSRWVHLNTNTLAMRRVCAHLKGFGLDVFYIQGDENPLNHWIYEFENESFVTARKFLKFLTMYDGVHVLLQNRSDIGKTFIPDLMNSRKDPNHVYGDYSPAHIHHNWRFTNVYDDLKKSDKDVGSK